LLLLYHFFIFADMLSPKTPAEIRNGLFNSSEAILFFCCVFGIVPVMIDGIKLNIGILKNAYVKRWGHPLNKGTRLKKFISKFKTKKE
jgi:hypothetical protein